MRSPKPASSRLNVDVARFELFLNVFVRTPERPVRRSGSRKRLQRQFAS
ncbi:hypothetical protein ACXR0O_01340 [Verrucomicrobiota bacterium sgz303538]